MPILLVLCASADGQSGETALYSNFNQQACSLTNSATLYFAGAAHVSRVELWYQWQAGETSAAYSMLVNDRVVRQGRLTRGSCDSAQANWCVAADRLEADFAEGFYEFRTGRPALCQNRQSLTGFVRAFGTYRPATASVLPARTAPSPKKKALVPVTSAQDVAIGDFHLRIGPGWTVPERKSNGTWDLAYAKPLRNGPASPVTPVHVTLYPTAKPYSTDAERHETVEQWRAAVWRGKAPLDHADTMKLAGVKADRFVQKGDTGWRFYLFPYNGAQVYYLFAFSPGDRAEPAPEALQLLSTLKINPPPKPSPAVAAAKPQKPPKDYLKNVGGGLNFFSEEDEYRMGEENSEQMNQSLSLIDDTAIQSYVESLGQRLVAASRKPDLRCRFFVVNTREVNAFALPGCFVYVNRALIDLAQSEGQLAGVMGHEIGHVVGHHAAKQISKQILLLGLVEAAGAAVGEKSEKWAEIIEAAGGIGTLLGRLKWSRDDEHQADALGIETMAAAGYDPHDLEDFFRLMAPDSKLDKGDRIMGILSTHPITADREKVLAQQVAAMTYRGDAESAGVRPFGACRAELGRWPQPAPDSDVTLTSALAALQGDSAK